MAICRRFGIYFQDFSSINFDEQRNPFNANCSLTNVCAFLSIEILVYRTAEISQNIKKTAKLRQVVPWLSLPLSCMLDVWKEQAPFQRQATKVRKLKKKVEIGVRGILFVCLFVYLVGWLYSLSKTFGGLFW